MIVADTSAWIEFFRRTGSPVNLTLRRLLSERAEIAVTQVVVMEVLAGARSRSHLAELRDHMLLFPVLPLEGLSGYEAAAELFRICRAEGESVRNLTDCLVAVVTIEAGASLLHNDRDFETLARWSELRIEPPHG